MQGVADLDVRELTVETQQDRFAIGVRKIGHRVVQQRGQLAPFGGGGGILGGRGIGGGVLRLVHGGLRFVFAPPGVVALHAQHREPQDGGQPTRQRRVVAQLAGLAGEDDEGGLCGLLGGGGIVHLAKGRVVQPRGVTANDVGECMFPLTDSGGVAELVKRDAVGHGGFRHAYTPARGRKRTEIFRGSDAATEVAGPLAG